MTTADDIVNEHDLAEAVARRILEVAREAGQLDMLRQQAGLQLGAGVDVAAVDAELSARTSGMVRGVFMVCRELGFEVVRICEDDFRHARGPIQ